MIGVSVIVPVYNVEDYLEECLESIVNQSYEDIEIICVNDGSTDDSLSILEEYEKADERIKIITQENRGLGGARNTGLDHAQGKYIYFCDSDDYLELTALDELISIAEDKDLDLLLFKLRNFEDKTKVFSYADFHEMRYLKSIVGDKVFDYHDITEVLLGMDVTVYTKLFKRDLISDARFDEDFIFEDNLFQPDYIFNAKRIYFYDKHLYNRRVRDNSIITSHSKSYADVIEVYNGITSKIKEHGLYDVFKEKLFISKVNITIYRFGLINEEHKEYFFNLIKKDFTEKQMEYDAELDFSRIDEKTELLFYEAIHSKDYMEYELRINMLTSFEQLKPYKTARIDIKNFGNESNRIIILSNSDSYSREARPKWFKNKDGEGVVIESFNDSLDLEIQAVGDGELRISLRSQDIRDKNNERFPVFIDYTGFSINDVNYLDSNVLVNHNNPFIIKQKVDDCEICKIHLEWSPFTKQSVYNGQLQCEELKSKNRELEQKINELENENESLRQELDEIHSSKMWKFAKRMR